MNCYEQLTAALRKAGAIGWENQVKVSALKMGITQRHLRLVATGHRTAKLMADLEADVVLSGPRGIFLARSDMAGRSEDLSRFHERMEQIGTRYLNLMRDADTAVRILDNSIRSWREW